MIRKLLGLGLAGVLTCGCDVEFKRVKIDDYEVEVGTAKPNFTYFKGSNYSVGTRIVKIHAKSGKGEVHGLDGAGDNIDRFDKIELTNVPVGDDLERFANPQKLEQVWEIAADKEEIKDGSKGEAKNEPPKDPYERLKTIFYRIEHIDEDFLMIGGKSSNFPFENFRGRDLQNDTLNVKLIHLGPSNYLGGDEVEINYIPLDKPITYQELLEKSYDGWKGCVQGGQIEADGIIVEIKRMKD